MNAATKAGGALRIAGEREIVAHHILELSRLTKPQWEYLEDTYLWLLVISCVGGLGRVGRKKKAGEEVEGRGGARLVALFGGWVLTEDRAKSFRSEDWYWKARSSKGYRGR